MVTFKYLLFFSLLGCTYKTPPIYFKQGDIVTVPTTERSIFYGCGDKAKIWTLHDHGLFTRHYTYDYVGCSYSNESPVDEINKLNGK